MKTTIPTQPLTAALSVSQHNNIAETIDGFRQAMHEAGLVPPTVVVADGKFHRFFTNGKPSDDAGWYLLNEYAIAVGFRLLEKWNEGFLVSY